MAHTIFTRGLALLVFAALLGAVPSRCTDGLYVLSPEASFVFGCFDGPCLCPVAQAELRGFLRLVEADGPDDDAGFRHFDVLDVSWRTGSGEHTSRVHGTGHYRVGSDAGEPVQQLVLDLERQGETRRFDSGLVPGGGAFPEQLDVDVSLFPGGSCYNELYGVRAERP